MLRIPVFIPICVAGSMRRNGGFYVKDFDILNKGEILQIQGRIDKQFRMGEYLLTADFDLAPYVGQEVYLTGKWDMEKSSPEQKFLTVLNMEEIRREALSGKAQMVFDRLVQRGDTYYLGEREVYSDLPLGKHENYKVVAMVQPGEKGDYIAQVQRLDNDMMLPIEGDDHIYGARPGARVKLGDYYPGLSAPLIVANGRILADAYDIGRMLYAQVSYDVSDHLVVLESSKDTAKGIKYLWSETIISTKQGMEEIDVAPVLFNRRLMIPLRKTFDYFGYKVEWDQATQTVVIN